MYTAIDNQTNITLSSHLRAFSNVDLDAILNNYAEDSVLFTPAGAIRGKDQLRKFFTGFIKNLPAGFMESFDMLRKDVDGEIGYVVWQSGAYAPMGTETFVVREGKIKMQTFTAYSPS